MYNNTLCFAAGSSLTLVDHSRRKRQTTIRITLPDAGVAEKHSCEITALTPGGSNTSRAMGVYREGSKGETVWFFFRLVGIYPARL